MKADLNGIKPGFTIRSDIFGFYICSVAEAEQYDSGDSPSCGYDLRPHWDKLEDAVSALQNRGATPRSARSATYRRPPTTGPGTRASVHACRHSSAAPRMMRRMPFL